MIRNDGTGKELNKGLLEIKFTCLMDANLEDVLLYVMIFHLHGMVTDHEFKDIGDILKDNAEEFFEDSDDLTAMIDTEISKIDAEHIAKEPAALETPKNIHEAYLYQRALFRSDILIELP